MPHEVRQIPPIWCPAVPQWHNYADVWSVRLLTDWVVNTIFITIVADHRDRSSRRRWPATPSPASASPARTLLFSITMATLMLPGYVLLIPNFLLFWKLGWLNTYLPLTVPFCFGSSGASSSSCSASSS